MITNALMSKLGEATRSIAFTKGLYFLLSYDEVFFIRECGKWDYSVGVCLRSSYAPDHKVIRVKSEEVYTEADLKYYQDEIKHKLEQESNEWLEKGMSLDEVIVKCALKAFWLVNNRAK